ncbi:hypothetical protein AD942_02165 [Gluconobacter japonicus]|uniref:hypothetical protein n=1 Tax=Gluconobacter TaxID=441 RepID=UPI0007820356|nr:hypothetical protein [Gluconobacter japonicus]KXV41475.1 hypothetical protein AD942_02165 [Gluconobacter japonicus]KXV42426.1 hypothetical protein AD936_12030 [Gluconobacter japonicus]MBS1051669.1 hypothetical protein [Gluconobacter japonicus]
MEDNIRQVDLFFASSIDYIFTAKSLIDVKAGESVKHPLAMSMLIAHGIECFLKAWLVSGKYKDDNVKRFGHDLKVLLREAKDDGLEDSVHIDELVDLFAHGHSRESNFANRYLNNDHQYRNLISRDLLVLINEAILEMRFIGFRYDVSPYCGGVSQFPLDPEEYPNGLADVYAEARRNP